MNELHRHVPQNRFGRDFVVSDLHGHLAVLQRELERRFFTPGRDRLFSVGDLIDRGPDSPGTAALIRERWFHAVRGNHEDMLLRTLGGDRRMLDMWRLNGGEWGIEREQPSAAARAVAPLCATLPYAITLHHRNGKRFGICHAQCPVSDWGRIAEAAQDALLQREMLWARERVRQRDAPPTTGVDWTIHGHTVVHTPLASGNAMFIETGVFLPGGTLTLLCLDEL